MPAYRARLDEELARHRSADELIVGMIRLTGRHGRRLRSWLQDLVTGTSVRAAVLFFDVARNDRYMRKTRHVSPKKCFPKIDERGG